MDLKNDGSESADRINFDLTVFGKPNFGDPTLFEKKHEVLGYYTQKWKTGDYGAFQPETAILPQVRHENLNYVSLNDFIRI